MPTKRGEPQPAPVVRDVASRSNVVIRTALGEIPAYSSGPAAIPAVRVRQGTIMQKKIAFSVGLVLAGCLVAGLASIPSAAQAAQVSQTAPIAKFSGVDEIVEACTTGSTFTNMPSMSRAFTLGGSSSDQVVATFQAAASLSGDEPFDTGFIRLTIDGTAQGPADGLIPLIGSRRARHPRFHVAIQNAHGGLAHCAGPMAH